MINYIMNLKIEHCVKKKKKRVLFCSCLPHSPHSYVGQQTHDVLQLDLYVQKGGGHSTFTAASGTRPILFDDAIADKAAE